MPTTVKAYAAKQAAAAFEPFEYELPEIGPDDVDIRIEHCGICHSDLSMLDNDWQQTRYPFVGGHEIIGTVAAKGEHVPGLIVGQRVGLGWYSRSCMHCDQCMGGDHNLCPSAEGVISHQYGGFADKVRCHWAWAIPLPDGINAAKAGPLFCGGITVFNPLVQLDLQPTSRVAVIGIGGLGHLALMFLNKWGCEVTAFSRSADKEQETLDLGAHHYVNTKNPDALKPLQGKFDLILNTTNVALDWDALVATLAPKGVLHTVGAGPKVEATIFPMLAGQKSLSSSPLGSPVTMRKMIDFCARHNIAPVTETFPMAKINDAFDRLRSGKARYRLVLDAD